jgi:hypothetical protein
MGVGIPAANRRRRLAREETRAYQGVIAVA